MPVPRAAAGSGRPRPPVSAQGRATALWRIEPLAESTNKTAAAADRAVAIYLFASHSLPLAELTGGIQQMLRSILQIIVVYTNTSIWC